jgi:hypothetical protein
VTKRQIILAAVIVVIVGGVLVLGVALMPPGVISVLVNGTANDTSTLRQRAADFDDAFSGGRFDKVYRLFNSDFREELTEAQLDSGLTLWLAGRRVHRLAITHIEVRGLSGLVSSNIYFEAPSGAAGPLTVPKSEFLFQFWIRTQDGWQLLWLNKVLDPIALDYGHRDTASLKEILQLALDEIITRTGLEQKLGIASGTAPIVLLTHGASDRAISLAGRKILWLSKDEILVQQKNLRISFYIDVQPIRVLKHLAIGTFDIVSLRSGVVDRRPARSIKLFFVRESEHGKWEFADYGSKW